MAVTTAVELKLWITAVIFCIGVTVSGFGVSAAPLDDEKNETPFPLELQPPLVDNLQDAIDSYGNPITYSQPIETPDGRKVITAQGVQFEIPNYASGITEIKKPIENLLPPFIDPIAVALPNDALTDPGTDYSAPQQYTLPDWLADFNDPDVGPGVPYTPSNDANSQKVLSWDLVPPNKQDPETSTPNFGSPQKLNTFQSNQGFGFNRDVQVTTTSQPKTTTTTTTRKPTTTRRPTTTTTRRPTTTTTRRPTTTTTRRPTTTYRTTTTTTRRPTTTTTVAAVTFSNSNPDEFYELPGGNSVVLPSWLEGIDDPELSIAVPFEVPEDNNEYNHTVLNNLLPPLEPFEDLKVLSVSALQQSQVQSVAPTAFPTTTPPPTRTTTIKAYQTTFKPFEFKSFTKQPVTSQATYTQNKFFTTPPTTTNTPVTTSSATTVSPISNRIPQFTLKSSVQPAGFKPNSFLATQPTVKPTVQPVFDPKFNPFFNSRNGQNGFTSAQRPTTTTTTTPPPTTRQFLFGSVTTPSWLNGINGNPGLGVPFSLPGNSNPQSTFNGFLPPSSQVAEQTIDGSNPNNQPFTFTTPLPEPSRLFTPPMIVVPDQDDNSNSQSQTNLFHANNHFLAATEPTTKPTSKVTFNKSDQGKVISNSVFEPSTKPIFGLSQSSAPIGFTVSPFASTTSATLDQKYTGGFGGAPGVLGGQNKVGYAVQPDGSIRDPDHTYRPTSKTPSQPASSVNLQSRVDAPALSALQKPTTTTPGPKRTYTGSFGGPPGVLKPFDSA